ncbi:MAG: 16S rRNA (guanine(527)-N(7))-methyltransferase RsmG [Hyphomicrobiales bacterium]|nr:16S rRNA (guanine(527)-N(7))-methyltransferase RsmG [Hyphomicrobiales bacterium]
MSRDKDQALELFPALRGVERELDLYEELLRRWQKRINLVGPATLDHIWLRHFADSAQLGGLAAVDAVWADLGSGAGFPGLVIALMQKNSGGGETHLIESDLRKAAFLREVSRETGARAAIHAERAENALRHLQPAVIASRAMASMSELMALTGPTLRRNGAIGLFLKGQNVDKELTQASISSIFNVEIVASKVDRAGSIVRVAPRLS